MLAVFGSLPSGTPFSVATTSNFPLAPFLTDTFGNEYLQYRKKVCRYIGRKR